MKLLAKIALLAAAAFPLQIAVGNLGKDRSLRTRDRLDRLLAERAELVVFGDSTMFIGSPDDADRRRLSTMIFDALPGRRAGALEAMGLDLDVFRHYAAYLAASPHPPRDLVVPLNLRQFSPSWDLRPAFQRSLERLRFRWGDTLAFGLMRPLSTFKAYPLNPVTQAQQDAAPVFRGDRRVATLAEMERGTGPAARLPLLERAFVTAYMGALSEEHRKLRSLAALLDACRAAGIRVLPVVLPVDVESGERHAGADFPTRIAANVEVLRRVARAHGAELLDLSSALPAEDFDWPRTLQLHEHLREAGRKKVTEAVSSALRR